MSSHGTPEERFPEIFNQTNVNPRERHRDRPMKLLVIGMMRTGTASIKIALEELGIREVYHMTSAMKNPPDFPMWQEALNAKFFNKGPKYTRKEFDNLLWNCEACIDVPTAALMPELIKAYPEAKVIICMRDPEKWYQSFAKTVGRRTSWRYTALTLLDPFFFGKAGPMKKTMLKALFGEGIHDEEHVKAVYIGMHEEVRRMVPQEKLLEFKLSEGWGTLCKFLERPVPDSKFPFNNESHDFMERNRILESMATKRAVLNILYVILLTSLFTFVLYFAVSYSGYGFVSV